MALARILFVLSAASLLLGAGPTHKAARPSPTPTPAASPAASGSPGASATPADATPTPEPTPSLDESVEFLKEKLGIYGTYKYPVQNSEDSQETGTVSGSAALDNFDKPTCTLTLKRAVDLETGVSGDSSSDYSEKSVIELTLPLRELDPAVKKGPLPSTFRKVYQATSQTGSLTQIVVSARGGKKAILVKEDRTTTEKGETQQHQFTDPAAQTYLIFSDEEIANRARKALEHAIELCERRKDKF